MPSPPPCCRPPSLNPAHSPPCDFSLLSAPQSTRLFQALGIRVCLFSVCEILYFHPNAPATDHTYSSFGTSASCPSFFKTSLISVISPRRRFHYFLCLPSPASFTEYHYSIYTKQQRHISHNLHSHYTNICHLYLQNYLPPNHYVSRSTTLMNLRVC